MKKALILSLVLTLSASAERFAEGITPLHNAWSEESARLIAAGADVNARDAAGRTPLFYVDYPPKAELLLRSGADVNARDNDGNTPLLGLEGIACGGEELQPARMVDIIRMLADAGADMKARNKAGHNALDRALAVKWNGNLPDALRPYGLSSTPGRELVHACGEGHLEKVRRLLAEGTDPNSRDIHGNYALSKVLDEGVLGRIPHATEIMEALLAAGANPDVENGAALYRSCMLHAADHVQLLLKYGADATLRPLHFRTLALPEDLVQQLRAAGANIEAAAPYATLVECVQKGTTDELARMVQLPQLFPIEQRVGDSPFWHHSYTPLAAAIRKNDMVRIRILLTHSPDVHAIMNTQPLLVYALFYHASTSVVRALLSAGAKPDARSYGSLRCSPMYYAATRSPEMLKLLQDAGASISEPCAAGGVTPLMRAVDAHSVSCIHYLLEAGVDVNARDERGRTALHYIDWATTGKSLEVARMLLAAGADVNARDARGCTPLLASPGIGRGLVEAPRATPELIELYLAAGADLRAVDNRGCNALEYALSNNYSSPQMIQLLRSRGLQARPDYELLHALQGQSPERVRALLSAGASPDARSPQHDTPAVKHCLGTPTGYYPCSEEMLKILLDAGAAADTVDDTGCSALSSAVAWGSLSKVEMLLSAGADVRRQDYLATARPREWKALDDTLLAAGAHPLGLPQSMEQMLAGVKQLVEQGDEASLCRLSALGCPAVLDFNASLPGMPEGCTALMLAAQRGNIQAVRLLLSMGADAAAMDANGKNAVDYATIAGHGNVADLLRKTYAAKN